MKISIIGPVAPYRGGIAHFTTLLAKKLLEAGHDVQVISFKKQYPAWLYPGESDKDYSPGREKVEAAFILSPLDPLSWRKTINAIASFHPQMVILPWWVTFWGPAFHHIITHLRRGGIPVTILIHNTMPHEPRPWDRFLAHRTLKSADNFIVMTQKERDRLSELLPEENNINVVPHPIYQIFKPTFVEKQQLKLELGLPLNMPIILFFGFIRPYKGLSDLISALNLLISRGKEICLVVAGEFWDSKEAYKKQIDAMNLNNFIYIFDKYIPDDEAGQFFEVANVFVAPYSSGTQSGSLKTALGYGLPVVATDVIMDKIMKSHPDRCKIVPAGEAEALAAGVEEQLNKPILTGLDIENLVDRSWVAMLNAVSEIPEAAKSQSHRKNK